MFQQVISTYEGQYHKINYKYKRCKYTKTKACWENISCEFICIFIFLIFSSMGQFKFSTRCFPSN